VTAVVAASPAVRLETGPAALELLDEPWDELLRRVPLPNPLLSATWLRALARWQTGTPLVAVAEREGRLVAGAALELRRPGGRLGPHVATWLGPIEQLCSADLLVDPERPQAGEAVIEAVLEQVDVLSIGTPASGGAARTLAAVAPWRRETTFSERWLLSGPPPRLDYVRRQAGYDLRRAARRGAEVEVRVAAEPDDVARALTRLFRVHRDRWRERPDEQARIATTQVHRGWNLRTIVAMAARGNVRLVEVVEDGRTVAASLGLLHGCGGLAHTTAVRVGGVLRQPGHLAALARFEALAQAGATAIDLGHGAGEPGGPKRRLGPEPDPLVMLFAARSPSRQHRYEAVRRLRSAGRHAARLPV
jgi:CelD/BcsL family acetyltransferase involved in cellulose biosynthesis